MYTREPCGTIIEAGKLAHNDGNGFGLGVKDGKLGFGTPWGDRWSDFLTGYNSPVQGGEYVAPAWVDNYVFPCRLARIAVGKAGNKTYIVVDDNVTLKQFATNAIKQGFDTLVNLDGGGSRHLLHKGTTIYYSSRVPYNAIAWYGETEKGLCPYRAPNRVLRWGSSGEDVKWLQWQLNRHGSNLGIDGSFGALTWAAVLNFQRKAKIGVDGVVGSMTVSALSGTTV